MKHYNQDSFVVIDDDNNQQKPTHSVCPNCGEIFKFRSNKTYCSARCRDASKKRNQRRLRPENAASSISKQRDQEIKFDTALRIAERLYSIPPRERLGYMEQLIQIARSGASPLLKDILTTPKMLSPCRDTERHLFYRKRPQSYYTLSQAANRYCLWSPWKDGVVNVVKGITPEPPTGELGDVPTGDNLGFGWS